MHEINTVGHRGVAAGGRSPLQGAARAVLIYAPCSLPGSLAGCFMCCPKGHGACVTLVTADNGHRSIKGRPCNEASVTEGCIEANYLRCRPREPVMSFASKRLAPLASKLTNTQPLGQGSRQCRRGYAGLLSLLRTCACSLPSNNICTANLRLPCSLLP